MTESDPFASCFESLTGHAPFGWQARLYERFYTGDLPPECDIPTGLGKTSVLAVWLLALAAQAARPGAPLVLPRRLVYVVDRRAVVDQATSEAEQLRHKLREPGPTLAAVAAALGELAVDPDPGEPFALSTLRGQFADNRRWSHDPARPAIIVGTVDMIGSRLLFQGYGGLGPYNRSQHAALLGQDALVVLDEAQLAPAFLQTLRAVERTVRATAGELERPFACLSLTATQPRTPDASEPVEPAPSRPPLGLEPADFEREETVRRRVRAAKHLRFVPPESGASGKADDALAQRMAREAVRLAGTNGAVVVFVDTVSLLEKIDAALAKLPGLDQEKQLLRFNGQLRGYERDGTFASRSEKSPGGIFQEFQRPRTGRAARGYPIFLLATSAGEVGVNFDADHAVCDLVSLERMAQRLGRVNRTGDLAGPAQVLVFLLSPSDQLKNVHAATHRLLADLPPPPDADGHLASPEELGKVLRRSDAASAFTPASGPPPLDPARLDDWSLTSLRQEEFARPQVSYWLRGITPDDEQTVTQLVWREELCHARDAADAADLAETCPPLPREIVQVPTYRAVNWLANRLKKHGGFAALRTATGKWEKRDLSKDFADKDRFKDDLANATLVLPTTVGGLKRTGFLDDAEEGPTRDVLDDPDAQYPPDDRACRRVLFVGSPTEGWEAFDLPPGPEPAAFAREASYPEIVREAARHFGSADGRRYRLRSRAGEPEPSADADDGDAAAELSRVEYFAPARVYKRGGEIGLEEHLAEAKRCAEGIVSRLGLPAAVREAVVLAAAWHDLGKDREKWQRAIGNPDLGRPLAKSNRPFYDHGIAEGYRHEFGSLMDALHDKRDELHDHPERALILHLIAAHHGHGRPGFQEKAYDVPKRLLVECAEEAQQAELRFDALQRRFGWWGLAYLEALVKCADGIASDRAANPPEDTP